MENYYELDSKSEDRDGLIWKTVLRTGKWQYTPDIFGRPVNKPLIVKRGKTFDDERELSLDDLKSNFDRGAVEHVTVPKNHRDLVDENTGYVKDLKISADPDRGGEYVLQAGIEFTEPDIKQKVINKSIANTSCKITPYINKESGEHFNSVLRHVCITNQPWINGMRAFSEEEYPTDEFSVLRFSDGETFSDVEEMVDNKLTKFLNSVKELLNHNTNTTNNEDSSYNSNSGAFAEGEGTGHELLGGKEDMPKIKGLKSLELSEEAQNELNSLIEDAVSEAKDGVKTEFETQLSEATDREADVRKELDGYRSKEGLASIDAKIEEFKGLGLSECPGFLKEVRTLLLAELETGSKNILELSEDGKSVELSVTDIVDRLIDALPREDDRIVLSEQANILDDDGKPPVDNKKPSKSERVEAAEAWLSGKEQ